MTTSISVPLGVTNDGRTVDVDLLRDGAHWAIQGQTRSGKSQVAYNLLGRLASNTTVRILGCDPSSLLLAPHAERGESLIALGVGELSQAVEVLRWVRDETDRRIADLLEARSDKIVAVSNECPLLLVVLEEYAGLLEAAEDEDAAVGRKLGDRVEPQIRRLVRQLVAQSAKVAVRVLLTTQRAEASILGGASRSNFGVRLTMRVDNPDSVRMLHPAADSDRCEAVMSFAPGVGLLDVPGKPSRLIRGPVTGYRDYYERVLAFPKVCRA